jgi:hypothetical protein
MEVASIGFVAAPFGNWRSQFWSRSSTSQPCGTVGKVSDERDCDPSDTVKADLQSSKAGTSWQPVQRVSRERLAINRDTLRGQVNLIPRCRPPWDRTVQDAELSAQIRQVHPDNYGLNGARKADWSRARASGSREENVAIRWPGAPGCSRS